MAQAGAELLVLLFLLSPCWDYRLVPVHLTLISVLSDFLGSVTHLEGQGQDSQDSHEGALQSPVLSSLRGLLWSVLLTLEHIVPQNSFDLWSVSENRKPLLDQRLSPPVCLGMAESIKAVKEQSLAVEP